jgi:Zn-dependent dipeptidase, microsomal dipeptidase homolog
MDSAELHKSIIVIDGHCDSVDDLVGLSFASPGKGKRDFLQRSWGHVDLPRLLAGGVTCQFMAMFVDDEYMADPRGHTLRLLEALESVYSRTDRFRLARSAADIRRAKEEGCVASLMTIEGGEAIGESLPELRAFYDRGVRLMTLTWNRRNAIGRGAGTGDPAVDGTGGLSDFGRKVVAEMERLGMMVDASHLSDEALDDLLEIAQRPVVASHSNSREVCGHRRNLKDGQVERIAATGGLVAATFAGVFVDPTPARVGLERFLDHVDRLVSVAGADHVGIGSDFDGYSERLGVVLPDCSHMGELTAGLLGRGHSPDDVRKIMGGNWLRLIGEVVG